MWTGKMFVLPSILSKNSQGRLKQFYPFLLHPYWQHLENQKSNHFGGYIPNPRKAARDISVTRTVYKKIGIKGGIQEVWWTNSIHVDAVRPGNLRLLSTVSTLKTRYVTFLISMKVKLPLERRCKSGLPQPNPRPSPQKWKPMSVISPPQLYWLIATSWIPIIA